MLPWCEHLDPASHCRATHWLRYLAGRCRYTMLVPPGQLDNGILADLGYSWHLGAWLILMPILNRAPF
jgi:hypothetical protein